MSASQLLTILKLIAPLLMVLEPQEIAELNSLVDGISNPIEKEALKDLIGALDGFEKAELAKI